VQGLFPLQINPHFTNALPEGNWITVSQGQATPGGPNKTYLFRAGESAAGHR